MTSRERAQRTRLWKLYRITLEERDAIEAYQRSHPLFKLLLGPCLAVEHDHASGRIRGRMTWLVNRAYGMIEKFAKERTSDVLRALAEYHDNPPAVTALGGPRFGLLGQAKVKRKMVYGGPQLRDTTNKRRKK
jgi:hypothetical protein